MNLAFIGFSAFLFLGMFILYGFNILILSIYLQGAVAYPFYYITINLNVIFTSSATYQKEASRHMIAYFYNPAIVTYLFFFFNLLGPLIIGDQLQSAIPILIFCYQFPFLLGVVAYVLYGMSLSYIYHDGTTINDEFNEFII